MPIVESTYSEEHYRSITKAISWRVWATLTTMIISFFITGNVKYAVSIGTIEVFVKIILYYFHERFWNIVAFGKPRA